MSEQDDPFDPGCAPTQYKGGTAEQEQGMKDHPMPGFRKIEEERFRPGRIDINQGRLGRHPVRVAPKHENIRRRHRIVQKNQRTDADAYDLQRNGRHRLKPDLRPHISEVVQCASAEICKCRHKRHRGSLTCSCYLVAVVVAIVPPSDSAACVDPASSSKSGARLSSRCLPESPH